jgi:hypothetical protein
MVEKLKSILSQTRSSLLAKAIIFALAWFLLPFWLFIVAALYLYLVSLFQADKLAVPFSLLLVLTYIEPHSFPYAIVFAAFFYYLLLIKDLLLIDRKAAYEILVLGLFFFLFRSFYAQFGGTGVHASSLLYSFLMAILFALSLNSFILCFEESNSFNMSLRKAASWLSFVIMWQFLILGLFLPLNAIYQSAILFLLSILVVDLVPEYALQGGFASQKVFVVSSTIFSLLVVVLASAHWGI